MGETKAERLAPSPITDDVTMIDFRLAGWSWRWSLIVLLVCCHVTASSGNALSA